MSGDKNEATAAFAAVASRVYAPDWRGYLTRQPYGLVSALPTFLFESIASIALPT